LETEILVNGTKLERDPAAIQKEKEINAANKAAGEKFRTESIAEKKTSDGETSGEDGNA
jgi:hypothetical protein